MYRRIRISRQDSHLLDTDRHRLSPGRNYPRVGVRSAGHVHSRASRPVYLSEMFRARSRPNIRQSASRELPPPVWKTLFADRPLTFRPRSRSESHRPVSAESPERFNSFPGRDLWRTPLGPTLRMRRPSGRRLAISGKDRESPRPGRLGLHGVVMRLARPRPRPGAHPVEGCSRLSRIESAKTRCASPIRNDSSESMLWFRSPVWAPGGAWRRRSRWKARASVDRFLNSPL